MRALVFTAAGRVELLDVADPDPAPGETAVTVHASGICGSELHGFRSVGMRQPPLVMGHEFAGTTGSGARVVVNPLLVCHTCDSCLRGKPQVCRSRVLLGVSRAGGYAERVAVPDNALHPLPDGIDWGAAALIEPLANGVHAWALAGNGENTGQKAGVIGAGAIGLVCALIGRAKGIEVTISDTAGPRRVIAESLGLTVTTELTGEYDIVFDAVGTAATRTSSVEVCRPAGTAVWLGLATDEVALPGNSLVRQEKRVLGSFAYAPADFVEAISLASTVDLSWTTDVPLSQADRIFYSLAGGNTSIAKAVIVPDAVRAS